MLKNIIIAIQFGKESDSSSKKKKIEFCINVYRLFTRALSDICFAVVAYA
jgi:hypothetical protein